MGQIQQARYDHLLRRTTAQTGPQSKVGNALEDLFPTLEVENCPSELLRAVGWKLGAGQIDILPAAATRASIQIFNPAGSGHFVVVTRIVYSCNGSSGINAGPSFDALTGTSNPGQQRDTRDGVLRQTVALIQEQDDALVNSLHFVFLNANTNYILGDPNDVAVLSPGTGWRLTTPGDDIRLRVSFFYRERVAEPEELNF